MQRKKPIISMVHFRCIMLDLCNVLLAWIRRRLRSYLWRQWQNGHNRFNELRRRGVSKFNAAVAAGSPTGFWRMSGHPAVQQALRNHYFDSLGLPRLHVSAQA
jgi:RNA-directed DNA polymerase